MRFLLSDFLYKVSFDTLINDENKEIIKKFLKKTKNISDDRVHELAAQLGIKTERVEEYIYSLAREHLIKHVKEADEKETKSQLEMGKKIEKEHSGTLKKIKDSIKDNLITMTDAEIFESIAKDHIAEKPDYYTLLVKYVEGEHA